MLELNSATDAPHLATQKVACWSAHAHNECFQDAHLPPAQEVADAKACAPVLCMHRDGHGNVWSGHVGGGVGVWSETRRAMCCPIFRACKSDIR
jgi:hypothetical protein